MTDPLINQNVSSFLYHQRLLREDWGFRDNAVTHACSSLAAGLVAAALGTPADIIKTRIMNQPVDPGRWIDDAIHIYA